LTPDLELSTPEFHDPFGLWFTPEPELEERPRGVVVVGDGLAVYADQVAGTLEHDGRRNLEP